MQPPPARATAAIAILTGIAWCIVASAGLTREIALRLGFAPLRLSEGLALPGAAPLWATPLTATLVHEGPLHLGFNLVVLGLCGRYSEPAVGPGGIVLLYLLGAYAAAGADYLAGSHDATVMVGASGAVSAVVGAYAVLFGQRRVRIANPLLAHLVHVVWLAAAWVGLQLLVGTSAGLGGQQVAVAAHIGGFLVGVLLARPLLLWRYRKA